jgi:F420-0:gamma-glutamyl ligase
MELEFIPIKTRIVHPPKDEIWDILDSLELRDGDIVFITSKILGIHQGRCVRSGTTSKEELIAREATRWLPYENRGGFHVNLTITDNILIPAAGIDESNADGHYIMWPKEVDKLCREIRARLMKRCGLVRLGVVSTDSHTTPLRWGVTGITTGLAGVEPLRDIRGHNDIFGRQMRVTQVNLIDPLSSMAVLLMGETDERTPIVILRGYDGIPFSDTASMDEFKISPDTDLYQPLLDVMEEK